MQYPVFTEVIPLTINDELYSIKKIFTPPYSGRALMKPAVCFASRVRWSQKTMYS